MLEYHLEPNRVGRLVFCRPEEKNKLSTALLHELATRLDELAESPPDKLLVHSSAEDCFAAGADMNELLLLDPLSARDYSRLGQGVMSRLERFPVPVVALVSGPCYGGAFDLALSCREIWATEAAVFCHPGAYLGIMTGFGGTVRLPERLPKAAARSMLLTGRVMAAPEAHELGLVNRLGGSLAELLDQALKKS